MEEVVYLIPLSRGRHAIVDEEDWEALRRKRWHANWNQKTRSWYAARNRKRRKGYPKRTMQMSREILRLESGDQRQVDHRNHHTLDNRRSNLRIVSPRGNCENRRDQSRHGVGVWRDGHSLRCPFRVTVQLAGKRIELGYYATAAEAQEARRLFLEQHHGH